MHVQQEWRNLINFVINCVKNDFSIHMYLWRSLSRLILVIIWDYSWFRRRCRCSYRCLVSLCVQLFVTLKLGYVRNRLLLFVDYGSITTDSHYHYRGLKLFGAWRAKLYIHSRSTVLVFFSQSLMAKFYSFTNEYCVHTKFTKKYTCKFFVCVFFL